MPTAPHSLLALQRPKPKTKAKAAGKAAAAAAGLDPLPEPELWWVSGRNGICYPAHYCPRTKRLQVFPSLEEIQKPAKVRKALPFPSAALIPALVRPVRKSATHHTAEELHALQLKWVTAHPNGPGSEGVPILVHDDGETYTVVGGAGGKLNQSVWRKGARSPEERKAAGARRKEEQAKREAENPEAFRKIREAKARTEKAVKDATKSLHGQILEKLGANLDEVAEQARQAAEAEARGQGATDEEAAKHGELAAKEAVKTATRQADSAVRQIVDAVARAEIAGEAPTATSVEALVGGKKLTKDLTEAEVAEIVGRASTIQTIRTTAAGLRKALRTGKLGEEGLEGLLREPTAEEGRAALLSGAAEREGIETQTRLVKESARASSGARARHEALGAMDVLNALSAAHGGQGISAALAEKVGVENAARIIAAHLQAGALSDERAREALISRIEQESATRSKEHAAAALAVADQLDALSEAVVQASEAGPAGQTGQALLAAGQAYTVQKGNEARKVQVLCTAKGMLRGAQALAQQLRQPSTEPLPLLTARTAVGARAGAASFGLREGDYTVKEDGKKFSVEVHPTAVGRLAQALGGFDPEQAVAMAEVRHERALGETEVRSPGLRPEVRLMPHQQLAVDAILRAKRVVGNMGAGSGKTAVMYAAADQLLASGAARRGLITMPAKPRSQQRDYEDAIPDEPLALTPNSGAESHLQGLDAQARAQALSHARVLKELDPTLGDAGAVQEAVAIQAAGGPKGFVRRQLAEIEAQGGKVEPSYRRALEARMTAVEKRKVTRTGEARKFLSDEAAGQFRVVESGAELRQALGELKRGGTSGRVLILSPEMMREHEDLLLEHGFGGKDSFYFGDEAHELSIGLGEAKRNREPSPVEVPEGEQAAVEATEADLGGSGKAQAAERIAKGVGHLFLGTGTAIENRASELYGLLHLADERAFPRDGAKGFEQSWDRLSQAMPEQGPAGLAFGGEMTNALSARLDPYMVSYHAPVTAKSPETGEVRELRQAQQVRRVNLNEQQRQELRTIEQEYRRDSVSPDRRVRMAAALRRDAKQRRAMLGGDTLAEIRDYVKERRQADPDYRAVLWSQELGPLVGYRDWAGKTTRPGIEQMLGSLSMGSVGRIIGANSDEDTRRAISHFNREDSDALAMVISNAGNFGVNLQRGREIIKYGHSDVFSKDQQIDARVNRFGQTEDTVSTTFIPNHPLADQRLHTVREGKGRQVKLLAKLGGERDISSLAENLDRLRRLAGRTANPSQQVQKALARRGCCCSGGKAKPGQKCEVCGRRKMVSMPVDEFREEHRRLQRVLASPSRRDDREEAARQREELREAIRKAAHDVSQEPRDWHGRWTKGGGGGPLLSVSSPAGPAGRAPTMPGEANPGYLTKPPVPANLQQHPVRKMLEGMSLNAAFPNRLSMSPEQMEQTWSESAHRGVWRSYGVVIVGHNGKILIRKPTAHYGGVSWSFPIGGSDRGEHFTDTAVREGREEAGMAVTLCRPLPGQFFSGSRINRMFMAVDLNDSENPLTMDDETEETRWVTLDEAIELFNENVSNGPRENDFAILNAIAKNYPSLPGAAQAATAQPRDRFPYETPPPNYDPAKHGKYDPAKDQRNWPQNYNPARHGPLRASSSYNAHFRDVSARMRWKGTKRKDGGPFYACGDQYTPVDGSHTPNPNLTPSAPPAAEPFQGPNYAGMTREEIHAQIVAHFLHETPTQRILARHSLDQKVAVLMFGGPGSGKSTYAETYLHSHSSFVSVAPDAVKPLLPDYDEKRAGDVHHESKIVAEEVFAAAVKTGRNVLIDRTGANTWEYSEAVKTLRRKGYRVVFVHVKCSLETARSRNAARSRTVPDWQFQILHQDAASGFEHLRHLADHVLEVDTE